MQSDIEVNRNFCCFNLRRRYGLTCRQGLAPSNVLQQGEGKAAKSPIHGYITQRGYNMMRQHDHSETASPKISLPQGDWVKNCSTSQVGLSAGGFATDRPSPSVKRHQQKDDSLNIEFASHARSRTNVPCSPSGVRVLDTRQGLMNFGHEGHLFAQSPCNQTITLAHEPVGQIAANIIGGNSEQKCDHVSSRLNGSDVKTLEQSLSAQEQQQRLSYVHHQSPPQQLNDHVDFPVPLINLSASEASCATPDRMHVVMHRATAALEASNALSKELSEMYSPNTAHAKSTPTLVKPTGDPSQSRVISQKPRSLAIAVSDDCDSSSGVGQLLPDLGIQFKEVSAAPESSICGISTEISVNIPRNANTAPILMIRRGSSNSSNGSTHSGISESFDDSAASECHKFDSNVCLDQSITPLHRQKLRSGTDALRPRSAGQSSHRSVRPDLASGLGFKTIDFTSRKSSDSVRVRQLRNHHPSLILNRQLFD
jgi:hypothetical protein